MGVIQVSEDPNNIWGVSGRLIYELILFAINKLGEKAYLMDFKAQFDLGYNAIHLYELTLSELKEFRQATDAFRQSGSYGSLGHDPVRVESTLKELIDKIDGLISSSRI
jgi:hypothetical protein